MITPQTLVAHKSALGHQVAALRRAAGFSQVELASLVFTSRSTIGNIECGRQVGTSDFWKRCDEVLQARGTLLDAYERLCALQRRRHLETAEAISAGDQPQSGIATLAAGGKTEEMLRRTLIMALAAFGVGQGFSPGDGDGLRPAIDDGQPDSDRVEAWREAAVEYGYDYLSTPHRNLITDLGTDLVAVQALLTRLVDHGQRQGLSAVAARLAGLISMASTNLGLTREAKHMWRVARRMADASAEPDAQLWVRGHETTLGIYQGRPLPVVLDLAERGLAIGSRTPTAGHAELLGGKAEALALLGRGREATDTLHEMERTFDHLPAEVTSRADSIFGWPEHRLRHAESFVYTTVGSIRQANRAQDLAMELYPQAQPVSRSQIELHRAECLVRTGHIADGVRHGTNALEGLPEDRRHQFVLAIASKVWRAVPAAERGRPDVSSLRDQLVAAGRVDLEVRQTHA